MSLRRKLSPLSDAQVHKLRLALEQREISERVEDDVDELESHYSPDAGAIESFVRRKRSEARTKNVSQQSAEISAATNLRTAANTAKEKVLTSAHSLQEAPERLEEASEQRRVTHENVVARTEEATRLKSSPQMLDLIIQEQRKTDEAIRLKEAEAKIEIDKTKTLNAHSVEMDFQRVMNTLGAITRYNHLTFDAFDEVRGRLITLIEESHRIEKSDMDMHLKGAILGQIQQAIAAYQEVYDAVRRRLVESGNGQETRQIASITELAGGGESGNPATPFKLHSAEPGDRD